RWLISGGAADPGSWRSFADITIKNHPYPPGIFPAGRRRSGIEAEVPGGGHTLARISHRVTACVAPR
ncbi:MAG: hypothetical protein QGF00_37565, partial [Planctomycetota bacterium]|nr:hypothetical protein [Planctomycetota bacterium]